MIVLILLQFLLAFAALPCARATIFVTTPLRATTCQAGKPCLVEWVDNGAAPVLSNIGACFVGLFNGQGRLVQQIEPVNVATVHSLTFIPDHAAGPNSDLYYINFTSINPIGDPPSVYTQYSPFFKLNGMTGSLDSPVASDTRTVSVPSSVAHPPVDTVSSTIVVSHSISSPSSSSTAPASSSSSAGTLSSSSSFVTSRASSSQSTSLSSSSTADPTPSQSASSAARHMPSVSLWHCILLLVFSIFAISLQAGL